MSERFSITASSEDTDNGIIQIGDFIERVWVPTGFWSIADYEEAWLRALTRVVERGEADALLTAVRDTDMTRAWQWWPMHRDGRSVAFGSQFLIPGQHPGFHLAHYRAFIEPPSPNVSTWRVGVDAIARFLELRVLVGDDRSAWIKERARVEALCPPSPRIEDVRF